MAAMLQYTFSSQLSLLKAFIFSIFYSSEVIAEHGFPSKSCFVRNFCHKLRQVDRAS